MINFILHIYQLCLWVLLGSSVAGIVIFTLALNPIAFVFLASIWIMSYFLDVVQLMINERRTKEND